MANIYSATQQKNGFSHISNRYLYIVIGIILGFCLFFLFKSCTMMQHLSEAKYSIGQDPRWRGLHLMGKEQSLSAFNNELLMLIAKQEHFRIHLKAAFDLMAEVEQNKIQGALTTLQPNYLNENWLLSSEPYFLIGPVLIISLTTPIKEWKEKRKKIVGIPNQTAHSALLLSLEKDSSIQIKIYHDILPALADLSEGRIDGAIFPAIPAYTYVHTFYKNELKIASLPLTNEGIRLVARKDKVGEKLIKQFNEGLETLRQNGTYHQLLEHWGLIDVEQVKP
jgi:polar amino acid transport system substrate-binding protein